MDSRISLKLEFNEIKKRLAQKAQSESAKKLALSLEPQIKRRAVKHLIDETKEAESIYLSCESLPIMSFPDITPERGRMRSGAALSPSELLRIMRLLKAAKRAKNAIKRDDERNIVLLPEQAEGLFYDDAIIKRIDESVESDERLADGASSELRNIRRRIVSENEGIREKLNAVIRSKEYAKYLQDAIVTMRAGRFVVPVKAEYRSMIKGMVHGESASGSTVFIEPMSVVEANNKLKELDILEAKETQRILKQFSNELRPYEEDLGYDVEILSYLDLVFAKAALAVSQKAFPPEISVEGEIKILKGRHPLIEESKVVPISFELSKEQQSMVITGPNTGGKTVTLKLIGLFSMMMQSGLFLPADQGSRLPIYEKIFVDIGDEQSIEQSLSTFSAHMKNTISIVKNADEKSLVLLDELGAGTDPEEGAALAMAILETISERGARIFATTHYSEIKAFALSQEGFVNASMEFDVSTLSPTYKLIVGVAGASNAFLISRSLGLPEEVLTRAKGHMNDERLKYDYLIKEAERSRRRAERQLQKARDMKRHAVEVDEKAKALEEELSEKRKKLMRRAEEEAYEIVKSTQDEMDDLICQIKKLMKAHASEAEVTKTIEKARRQLSAKKDVAQHALKESKKPRISAKPEEIKPGDIVKVCSIDAKGSVLSAPDSKGMVSVQAGIMKLNVHYTDLEIQNESAQKTYQRTSRVNVIRKSIPLSINLIGKTVDEALLEADKYLDDAFVGGLNEVTIIHGKGTGALSNAIRDLLKRHPHVKNFRAGKYGEGEQGVTVVELKR